MDWKKFSKIESVVKGIGHRRRLAVLFLLDGQDGVSLADIGEEIKTDYKNTSQHIQKMFHAGLIFKKSEGNIIRHSLTPLGKKVLRSIRKMNI